MSFRNEAKLILVIILVAIWFNPTNIFVDAVLASFSYDFLRAFGLFGILIPTIPWVIKLVLALLEVKVIEEAYDSYNKTNEKDKK